MRARLIRSASHLNDVARSDAVDGHAKEPGVCEGKDAKPDGQSPLLARRLQEAEVVGLERVVMEREEGEHRQDEHRLEEDECEEEPRRDRRRHERAERPADATEPTRSRARPDAAVVG